MTRTDPAQVMHYWIAAAACAAVASWALLRFLGSMRRDRLLADTPLVKIRSAAQGYGKLFGRARPAEETPILAPLSSRPCVWWRYEIAHRIRNSKGETRWETIDSGASGSAGCATITGKRPAPSDIFNFTSLGGFGRALGHRNVGVEPQVGQHAGQIGQCRLGILPGSP